MPSSSLLTEQGSEPALFAANLRKGKESALLGRWRHRPCLAGSLSAQCGSRAIAARADTDSSATPCSRHLMSSRFGTDGTAGNGTAVPDSCEGSGPALACECTASRGMTLLSRVASRVAGGWGVGSQQGCEQGLLSHGSARSRAASRVCSAEPFVISSQKGTATAFQKGLSSEARYDKKTFPKNLDVVRDTIYDVANDTTKSPFATPSPISRAALREVSGRAVDAWRNTAVRGAAGYAISTLRNSRLGFRAGKSAQCVDLAYPRWWPSGGIGRQSTCRLGVPPLLHAFGDLAPLSINVIGECRRFVPQRMLRVDLEKRRSLSGATIHANRGPVLVAAVLFGLIGREPEALEDAERPDDLEVPLNRPPASSRPFRDGGRRRPSEIVRGLGAKKVEDGFDCSLDFERKVSACSDLAECPVSAGSVFA